MPKRYFTNFPEISYNGFQIKDITVSAALVNKYVNIPYSYTSYDLDQEQRSDQVADAYYGDSYMSWMVFYSNKTVDPYYGWYLKNDEFFNFLIKKYGSIEVTQKTILSFRTNWYNDSRELTSAMFNSMFGEYSFPHSKYWDTNYSDDGQLMGYVRKMNNDVVNTNKLVKLKVANAVFNIGDLLDIKDTLNGNFIGTAEVISVDGFYLYIKNVIGNIGLNNFLVKDSTASINSMITDYSESYTITDDVWTKVNIAPDEYVYWAPYTVFDMEIEKNDQKKSIKLVDPRMALKIANSLEEELNGRK